MKFDKGTISINRTKLNIFVLALLFLFFSACVRTKYFPEGNIQNGFASWYGDDFHGKLTSNMEIYNMNDMTAAHKTLPFGTRVIVTNLNNHKTVTVRINDRGPFVEGRDIDLSYAAAKVLGMIGPGVVPVTIEIIRNLSPPPSPITYSIQIGSFSKKTNAVDLKQKLGNRFGRVYIIEYKTGLQTYFRVRIKAKTRDGAKKIAARLKQNGYTVIILEEQ
ncbi:MAG: septal ring lytic transglycosylase RlpA family protein [Candidatus Aminicenantaceae bacterium]